MVRGQPCQMTLHLKKFFISLNMIDIVSLTEDKLEEAIDLVFNANLDTRSEIEHHLQEVEKHFIAVENNKIIGVMGWYQDNINYAKEAMGDMFPGEDRYWVGFFAVAKEYRGKGIGTRLLQTIENIVTEKGEDELWVSSVPDSQSYYEKQGFQKVTQGKIEGQLMIFLKKEL